MQDTTVSGMCFASDSGAKSRRRVFSRAVRHANEDELLIGFWADDHIPAPRTGSG
jgi:hypothetical protein